MFWEINLIPTDRKATVVAMDNHGERPKQKQKMVIPNQSVKLPRI